MVAKRLGSAIAAIGLLAGGEASAAMRPPIGLRCTVVGAWVCETEKACRAGEARAESYGFDLVALTYRAPQDRGAITDLETDDRGFMTFLLGGGQRYVHKNAAGDADANGPMTSFLYVSAQDMRELRCTARFATTAWEAHAGERRKLAGHYYLSGVMETGSELLLRLDGGFSWFMSYGAVDRTANGTWRVDGDAVQLDAQASAGAEPAFRQLRLRIEDGALLPNGVVEGRYERHP